MTKRSRLTTFGAVMLTFMSFLVALGYGCGAEADDIQSSIEEQIKPGATLSEIRAYLNSEGKELGIEWTDEVTTAEGFSRLRDFGISADTPIVSGVIPGDPRAVTVVFILNENLRFVRLIVWDVFTS